MRRGPERCRGLDRTGATFADAAAEFLGYAEHDRGCKPSTLRDFGSSLEAHLIPAFGSERLESITAASIDRWRGSLTGLSNRTKNKLLVVMHGVFRRAQHLWGLPMNPVASVQRHPQAIYLGLARWDVGAGCRDWPLRMRQAPGEESTQPG